jgi:uncharacterized membrane protein
MYYKRFVLMQSVCSSFLIKAYLLFIDISGSIMSTTPTTVFDYLDSVAVLAAGIYAGTALYTSIGQAPALREYGLNEQWKFFPYMFKNTAVLQVSFSVIAGAASVIHATRIQGAPFYRNLWFAAGSTFLAMIPYTLVFIAPIYRKIISDNKSVKSGSESQINIATKKELLDNWAMFHLVRTVGSVASFGAMVFGLSRHSSLLLTW